jgi:hypothetical protein
MTAGINNEQSEELKGRTRRRRRRSRRGEPMVLMPRDREIVEWVYENKLATHEQVQRLWFGPGGRSSSQLRLTKMHRHTFLDTWPTDRGPNQAAVYYISSRSKAGLQFLRALHPEEEIEPHKIHPPSVEHSLLISSCRIATLQACQASGYTMLEWLGQEELAARMPEAGITPDAYLRIERPTAEGPKKSSFFLEVERSNKATVTQERRYQRYRDFYYDGEFGRLFDGVRALRVLVLVGAAYGIRPDRQIEKLANLCRRLNVPLVRFAPLEVFLNLDSSSLLGASIWREPIVEPLTSLF